MPIYSVHSRNIANNVINNIQENGGLYTFFSFGEERIKYITFQSYFFSATIHNTTRNYCMFEPTYVGLLDNIRHVNLEKFEGGRIANLEGRKCGSLLRN